MSAANGNGPFVQPAATTQLAPQVNQRGTVMTLGLLLVAVNVFTSEAGMQFIGNLTGLPVAGLTQYTQSGTWVAPRDIALQVLLVLLLAGFAGVNEATGSLALTLVAALWLLWVLQHSGLWSGLFGPAAPPPSPFNAGQIAGSIFGSAFGSALGQSGAASASHSTNPPGNGNPPTTQVF